MGCGISKFNNLKRGDASQLNTRLTKPHGPNDPVIVDGSHSSRHVPMGDGGSCKRRGNVGKEEACIDEESSSEGDLNDRDDEISYMASPSFRVYCVPSQLDEDDCNPEEIMEDQRMDFQNYMKGSSFSRKEKKGFRIRCFRHVCHSS